MPVEKMQPRPAADIALKPGEKNFIPDAKSNCLLTDLLLQFAFADKNENCVGMQLQKCMEDGQEAGVILLDAEAPHMSQNDFL